MLKWPNKNVFKYWATLVSIKKYKKENRSSTWNTSSKHSTRKEVQLVFTKSFRHLKWRNPESYKAILVCVCVRVCLCVFFPLLISPSYTAYIDEDLQFVRYLKCFFMMFPQPSPSPSIHKTFTQTIPAILSWTLIMKGKDFQRAAPVDIGFLRGGVVIPLIFQNVP